MTILFLNAWGEEMQPALIPYLKAVAKTCDIICLQEATLSVRELCARVLPGFAEYKAHKYVAEKDDFSLATYVRNGVEVTSVATVLEHEERTGLGLVVQVAAPQGIVHICNVHGMSRPGNKRDDERRLRQSVGLIKYFANKNGAVIIGGDFNLLPDTKSIGMFSQQGYTDLVKEYGVPTTRNRLAWERYPDNPQLFSDYVFVGQDIHIARFEVQDNEVSDHLPLILEVTI